MIISTAILIVNNIWKVTIYIIRFHIFDIAFLKISDLIKNDVIILDNGMH